jgi:hypothetical protein
VVIVCLSAQFGQLALKLLRIRSGFTTATLLEVQFGFKVSNLKK